VLVFMIFWICLRYGDFAHLSVLEILCMDVCCSYDMYTLVMHDLYPL